MIGGAKFLMSSPNSTRIPESDAEEVASLILSLADFFCWQTGEGGDDFQLWRLRKPVLGHAVGSLIARDELVRILRAARRLKKNYGVATIDTEDPPNEHP